MVKKIFFSDLNQISCAYKILLLDQDIPGNRLKLMSRTEICRCWVRSGFLLIFFHRKIKKKIRVVWYCLFLRVFSKSAYLKEYCSIRYGKGCETYILHWDLNSVSKLLEASRVAPKMNSKQYYFIVSKYKSFIVSTISLPSGGQQPAARGAVLWCSQCLGNFEDRFIIMIFSLLCSLRETVLKISSVLTKDVKFDPLCLKEW